MPRYLAVRNNQNWLILDSKPNPPKVICTCKGWDRADNAALIVSALEFYNDGLYQKFGGYDVGATGSPVPET